MKRFECVDDQKAAGFPVTAACQAAGVSTSGYYDWQQREAAGPTERQLAEAELVALMRQLFDDADGNYGVPRMYKALRKAGLRVNHKRVVRLMRLHGMAGRFRRRTCRTTFPGPDGYHIPDLLGRGFAPGRPDVAWCQDITYIPTREGWLLELTPDPGHGFMADGIVAWGTSVRFMAGGRWRRTLRACGGRARLGVVDGCRRPR